MNRTDAIKDIKARIEWAQTAIPIHGDSGRRAYLPEQAMLTIPHEVFDLAMPAIGTEFDALRALRAAGGGRISREYPAHLLSPLLILSAKKE